MPGQEPDLGHGSAAVRLAIDSTRPGFTRSGMEKLYVPALKPLLPSQWFQEPEHFFRRRAGYLKGPAAFDVQGFKG